MRFTIGPLTFLTHRGDVRVKTTIPLASTTQVRFPRVVLLLSLISDLPRSTWQLLRARVAPLPLVPLDLFLCLSLEIPPQFNLQLARLLVLLVLLLFLWSLRLPYQSLLLLSLLLSPLL